MVETVRYKEELSEMGGRFWLASAERRRHSGWWRGPVQHRGRPHVSQTEEGSGRGERHSRQTRAVVEAEVIAATSWRIVSPGEISLATTRQFPFPSIFATTNGKQFPCRSV